MPLAVDGKKECCRCHATLSVSDFYKAAAKRDGLSSECRQCKRAMNRANPERRNATHRRWSAANPGRKLIHRQKERLRKYCLPAAKHAEILSAQRGVCAICAGVNASGRQLSIDHCHRTGKVRGLLCLRCNAALGQFQDSPELLRLAALYLESH